MEDRRRILIPHRDTGVAAAFNDPPRRTAMRHVK
jgi:hypothetical protein